MSLDTNRVMFILRLRFFSWQLVGVYSARLKVKLPPLGGHIYLRYWLLALIKVAR